MTVARERTRYTRLTRVLHWLTAALVFTMLLIGFVMVNSLASYSRLVMVHKTLGVVILVVVFVRILNRLTHRAPALPATVGSIERKLVVATELSLYALLVAPAPGRLGDGLSHREARRRVRIAAAAADHAV